MDDTQLSNDLTNQCVVMDEKNKPTSSNSRKGKADTDKIHLTIEKQTAHLTAAVTNAVHKNMESLTLKLEEVVKKCEKNRRIRPLVI